MPYTVASLLDDNTSSVGGLLHMCFTYTVCNLQEAGEVDASGHPRGFFQPVLGGIHSLKHYPTLLTTQMSAARARDALTYLQVLAISALYTPLTCNKLSGATSMMRMGKLLMLACAFAFQSEHKT